MRKKFWEEQRLFIHSALRRYRDVGMLFPCSYRTAEKAISLLPIEKMKKIIEVGSGTGRLTITIQKRMAPKAELFCIEKNPEFCGYLAKTFRNSNAVVINESVENILRLHPDVVFPLADCVVLSLPAAMVSDDLRLSWLEFAQTALNQNGYCLIHQFLPVLRKYINDTDWVKRNHKLIMGMPPFFFEVYQKITPS